MSMQPFEISIPIRPYLKKFVASYADVEPFNLSLTRCHVSGLILESLKKDYKRVDLKDKKALTDRLRFTMSSETQKKKRFWMDERTVEILDYRLRAMFNQQLCDFITISQEERGDIKKSALKFLAFYKIPEDDLQWETVAKMYYRARHEAPSTKKQKMEAVMQMELKF